MNSLSGSLSLTR